MVRHPLQYCATTHCCFCCDLDPEVSCYTIAIACIVINGFSGTTNMGIGHWSLYFLAIVNILLHISAGIALMLGTLWAREGLKILYCWLVFIGVFTVVVAFILFLVYQDSSLSIWTNTCDEFKFLGVIFMAINVLWLLFWDIYTPMIVLGNLGCETAIQGCVTASFDSCS